jgi:7,8-dihydropterin-6-yl-methyl-4-(beta-D-ribofuranosyl)aminobenzene 5'-phosphate synthase
MLSITILTENQVRKRGLLAEHGLSLWIENRNSRILFDAGQTDVYLKNAAKLGIDLNLAQSIVMSHGHYDHGGGLAWYPLEHRRPRVFAHPDAFLPKFAVSNNPEDQHRPIGLPWRPDQINHLSDLLTYNRSTMQIGDNLFLCNGIPAVTDFEPLSGNYLIEKNEQLMPDVMHDEQVLVCTCDQGLAVVLGCSHPGVVNCLKFVRLFFSEIPIRAVIGGMHLEQADPHRLQMTIDYFREQDIQKIVPLHCTGQHAVWTMKQVLGDRVITACTGDKIVFE